MTSLKPIKSRTHIVTHDADAYNSFSFKIFYIYRLTTFIDNTQHLELVDIAACEDLNPRMVKGNSDQEKREIVEQRKNSEDFSWIQYTEEDIKNIPYGIFKDRALREGVSYQRWKLISESRSEIDAILKDVLEYTNAPTIQELMALDESFIDSQSQAKIDTFDSTPVTVSKGFLEWAVNMALAHTDEEYKEEVESAIQVEIIRKMINDDNLANLNVELSN